MTTLQEDNHDAKKENLSRNNNNSGECGLKGSPRARTNSRRAQEEVERERGARCVIADLDCGPLARWLNLSNTSHCFELYLPTESNCRPQLWPEQPTYMVLLLLPMLMVLVKKKTKKKKKERKTTVDRNIDRLA